MIDAEVVCRLLTFVDFPAVSALPTHMKALVRTLEGAQLRALLHYMTGLQSLPAWLSSHPMNQPLPDGVRLQVVLIIKI